MQAYENKSLLGAPGQAQAQSPSGNLLGKRMESIQR
jgi:hypothetical protein